MCASLSSAPGADRHQRLGEAFFDYSVGLLRAAGCSLGEVELRELLAVELSLNAQGVLVWLEKHPRTV